MGDLENETALKTKEFASQINLLIVQEPNDKHDKKIFYQHKISKFKPPNRGRRTRWVVFIIKNIISIFS